MDRAIGFMGVAASRSVGYRSSGRAASPQAPDATCWRVDPRMLFVLALACALGSACESEGAAGPSPDVAFEDSEGDIADGIPPDVDLDADTLDPGGDPGMDPGTGGDGEEVDPDLVDGVGDAGDDDVEPTEDVDVADDTDREDVEDATPACEPGCQAHEACVSGSCELVRCRCVDGGLCTLVGPACEPACASDDACPESYLCVVGRCLLGCLEDEVCLDGEICEAGRCVPGCRKDIQCGLRARCDEEAQTCVAIACVDDDECALGRRCEQDRCVWVGDIACDAAEACGRGWTCLSDGRCGECEVSGDCLSGYRCRERVCEIRPLESVSFERITLDLLRAHPSYLLAETVNFGYGPGAALIDFDDDGYVDMFLGTQRGEMTAEYRHPGLPEPEDVHACLYRNVSSAEGIAFEPFAPLCGPQIGRPTFALPVDFTGDGREELLILGYRELHVAFFHPTFRLVTIAPYWEEEPGAPEHPFACDPGAAVAYDLLMDGQVEVIIACQAGRRSFGVDTTRSRVRPNRILRYLGEDRFALVMPRDMESPDVRMSPQAPDWHRPLLSPGTTLGLAVLDVNDNGLLDVYVLNDTFSTIDWRRREHEPAGLWMRCEPGESCAWRLHHMEGPNTPCWTDLDCIPEGLETLWCSQENHCAEPKSWGSLMGFGSLRVGGLRHVYLADWGPNRFYPLGAQGFAADRAAELGIDHGVNQGWRIFSWGVVVDDFDRDGRDDVLLFNGSISVESAQSQMAHLSILMLQRPGGTFASFPLAGLSPPTHEVYRERVPGQPLQPWELPLPSSHRAAARVDFNLDGRLDLLVNTYMGLPQIYTESVPADTAPRCTLIPRARVVRAHGVGYALAPEGSDVFHERDAQGQMRMGLPSSILSSYQRGRLRFPSGAIVPFDCGGTPGPVRIEEPAWLRWETEGTQDVLVLDAPWLSDDLPAALRFHVRDFTGRVRVEELTLSLTQGRWRLPREGGQTHVMVQLGERYVGRWWELSDPAQPDRSPPR